MSDGNEHVRDIATLIEELRGQFGVKANPESCGPLLFVGIAESDDVQKFHAHVERRFGHAYKPAGSTAFLKNLADPLVRKLGGIRKEQTLFAKDLGKDVTAYCMFWPWGSNPKKVSVRVGFLCAPEDESTLANDFKF